MQSSTRTMKIKQPPHPPRLSDRMRILQSISAWAYRYFVDKPGLASCKLTTSCSVSVKVLCTFKASTYGKERNKFRTVQHSSTFLLPQSCWGTPIAEDHARSLQHTPRCCTRDWKLEKSALILALVIPLQLPSGCLQLIKASGSAECNISQSPVIYKAL